jgi:hypothetical protein
VHNVWFFTLWTVIPKKQLSASRCVNYRSRPIEQDVLAFPFGARSSKGKAPSIEMFLNFLFQLYRTLYKYVTIGVERL